MKSRFILRIPNVKKSWIDPGAPSTSTARPNSFARETMLCVWWNQRGVVHYELLKPGETVNTKRYQQQFTDLNCSLLEKRSKYRKKQRKVIFLHDNEEHTVKPIQALAEQRFGSYKDVKKWLDEWFAAKRAWHSQIVRKMGKMYSKRLSIL